MEQKLQEKKQKKRRVKALITQIELIEKWLDQFSAPASQKLLSRSKILKNTFDENQRVMVTLQQELDALQEKGLKSRFTSEEEKLKEYKALQTLLLESLLEIIDINQTLMINSSLKSIKIKKLIQLEETILPTLRIQIQTYKDQFNMVKTSSKHKNEVQNCKILINQTQQNFEILAGVLKQKIEDQIQFHLVNDPLQTIPESFT